MRHSVVLLMASIESLPDKVVKRLHVCFFCEQGVVGSILHDLNDIIVSWYS